jgi:hypothetical protein
MIHLAANTDAFSGIGYAEAYIDYRGIYPPFDPAPGLGGFLAMHWPASCRGRARDETERESR